MAGTCTGTINVTIPIATPTPTPTPEPTPVINGTFDTDLSGWDISGDGNYDVIWDNSGPTPGRAELRIYQCSHASLQQTFIISGPTLNFDWQAAADSWYEDPGWKLTIQGVDVISEGLPTQQGSTTSITTNVADVSAYVGQTATLTFYINPGSYCGNGDHANTYLWVDNIV